VKKDTTIIKNSENALSIATKNKIGDIKNITMTQDEVRKPLDF